MNVATIATRVIDNVERVIVGKRHEVERMLIALLCRGHVLIEDVTVNGGTPSGSGANNCITRCRNC